MLGIGFAIHRDELKTNSAPELPSLFDLPWEALKGELHSQSAPLMGERVTVKDENDLLPALGAIRQRPVESDDEQRANQKYGYILAKMRAGIGVHCSEEVRTLLDQCIESIQPYQEPKSFSSEEAETLYFLTKAIFCIFNQDRFLNLRERDRHRETIRNYRKALESEYYLSNPESEIAILLNKIAFSIYAEVDVQSFTQSVVEGLSSFERDVLMGDDGLPLEMIDQFMRTVGVDHLSAFHASVPDQEKVVHKIRGEIRAGFDPILQGNPPNVKFRLLTKDNILITSLRTPTPTDANGDVSLEFKAFLRHLKANGKKYAMINLQNRTDVPSWKKMLGMDGENVRSRNLEQLANEEEFRGVITVFTLDKNSEFYAQNDSELMNGRAFCNQFIRHLFDSSAFHVSEEWWVDEKFEKISQKIKCIYTKFFDEKDNLSPRERQDFIEIAYLFLTDFILQETGAEYYNTSCKDCVDRGTATLWLLAALMILLEIKLGVQSHPDTAPIDERIASLPAKLEEDAMWARKRGIKDERFERAQSAIYRMAEKINTVPGLAEELAEIFNFKSIYIPN